ncbi:MAG: AMP-binding protein [Clostridia bacterium]|nr:AMP-binding protein [Clostridia bacterium]
MKLNNIHGFGTIEEYVKYKLSMYEGEKKNFESLFRYMFDESENVMAEISDGYRIKRITYGAYRDKIIATAPLLKEKLADAPSDSIVGLYMANSVEWIGIFWCILMCGYRPLLMNTRLPDDVLEGILKEYSVAAVISDGKTFSVPTYSKQILSEPAEMPPLDCAFGTEVIFMSSGTTSNVKLCAYNGESFYYQVLDSINILKTCPAIGRHYKGQLKHLTLLPFYHVFGFMAVYLWFGFFSRTFVFPRDLTPSTIQSTVKKHEVTHIFAVPMVWERVYRAATQKIKGKGERTYRKFKRATAIVNSLGSLGDAFAKSTLREVRDGLFGDSIQFLISGGSGIDPEVIAFYNGIGYHLANGYGMTEVGITSVEKSNSKRMLNSASIGTPFGNTEYKVDADGKLYIKTRTRATRIISGGVETVTNYDEWFSTNDMASVRCDRFYLEGRADDLIVGEDGENINPVLVESQVRVSGVEAVAVVAGKRGEPVLVASIPCCFSGNRLRRIYDDIRASLKRARLEGTIRRILFTNESLVDEGELKVSRRRLAAKINGGGAAFFEPRGIDEHVETVSSNLEATIRDAFAEALGREPESISTTADFFSDLDGTSIDYFTLVGIIRSRFGIEVMNAEGERLSTVKDFWNYIKNS